MAVNYINGFQSVASAKYAVADLNDIFLDEKNPRFGSATIEFPYNQDKQQSIINYLIEFAEVLELANRINLYNGLYNEFTMSAYFEPETKRLVVLEGNRRIAACKILMNTALISERIKTSWPIPEINEETRKNIVKVNLVIYDNSLDAQQYIASKHTNPDVLKWSTVEQYNYYYTQFSIDKVSPGDISKNINGTTVTSVTNKIKQYALFRRLFDIVKKNNSGLRIETAKILPAISAFMPLLLGKDEKYGLDLEINQQTLEYHPMPSKRDLYEQILLKIGMSFFVRKPALKKDELENRPHSDSFRISADEIKGKNKVITLIEQDVRIPGLKSLLFEYNNIFEDKSESFDSGTQKSKGNSSPGDHDQNSGTNNYQEQQRTNTDSEQNHSSNTKQDANISDKRNDFFADIKYEHISSANKENLGLLAVCKEIRNISNYNGGNGYINFPISSAFLLRALIEQVLSKQLKKHSQYEKLKSNKRTPELSGMIEYFLKLYRNGNILIFDNDKDLAKDFNSCFDGFGTKDQLDTIIHRPEEVLPDKNFLNGLSKQGFKHLLQGFLDRFS